LRTVTVQRIVALVLTALGLFLVQQGMQHAYYGRLGPGSGFFPIWVGALLAALSFLLFLQSFFLAEDPGRFIPDGALFRRPLILAVACAAVVPALAVFGFRLTMFVFVLLVPFILERQRWYVSVAVAAVASFGTAYVFEHVLLVRLPHAHLPFLNGFGL
jgi:hypothetical protein